MPEVVRLFISYARADSTFVDRLEADLRARSFETWVDRRRLEGAQNWEHEIFRAIDWCSLMVVVLSPDADRSNMVEQEWRYALRQNKVVIPLLWRGHHIPSELEKIQWVDFDRERVVYSAGLKALLIAITDRADERSSLPTDSREFYKQAIEARQNGDIERAAILLQRLVDREPGYANGEAARDLTTVNEWLYAGRAQRLRQDAIEARRKGEYGREAGALQALVDLGRKDAWAEEYLPIAQRNREQLETYDAVKTYMKAHNLARARDILQQLWEAAPYFRDPVGIAPDLGLTLPPTYLHDKAIAEASHFQEARKLLRSVVGETEFQSPNGVVDAISGNGLLDRLRTLEYDLPNPSAGRLVKAMVYQHDQYIALQANVNAQIKTNTYNRREGIQALFGGLAIWFLILAILAYGGSLPVLTGGLDSIGESVTYIWKYEYGAIWLWGLIATVLSVIVGFPMLRDSLHVAAIKRQAAEADSEAHNAFAQWCQIAEQVHQERIAEIKRQIDSPDLNF